MGSKVPKESDTQISDGMVALRRVPGAPDLIEKSKAPRKECERQRFERALFAFSDDTPVIGGTFSCPDTSPYGMRCERFFRRLRFLSHHLVFLIIR